jgi:hypothetical protein
MKLLVVVVSVALIAVALPKAVTAGDFSESFDRVQQVWDNVLSFQVKAWAAINDELTTGNPNAANDFYNNVVPQEITDASKIALTQVFPGIANAVNVADQVDALASQAQNSQKNAGRDNTSATLEDQIGEYFGKPASPSPDVCRSNQSCACAVFTNSICPACPSGSVSAGGADCVSMQQQCASGSFPVAVGTGCVSMGLEPGEDDATYLSKSAMGPPSLQSATNTWQLWGQQLKELHAHQAAQEKEMLNGGRPAKTAATPLHSPSSASQATKAPPSPAADQPCPYKSHCDQCLDHERSILPGNPESAYRYFCAGNCTDLGLGGTTGQQLRANNAECSKIYY